MKKLFILTLLLCTFCIPMIASAAQYSGTITFHTTTDPGTISFDVTRGFADGTVYWVYNYCWDASNTLLSTEAYPVLWPSADSLSGTTFPQEFTLVGTHCRALVTVRPWNAQPIKNTVLDYLVS